MCFSVDILLQLKLMLSIPWAIKFQRRLYKRFLEWWVENLFNYLKKFISYFSVFSLQKDVVIGRMPIMLRSSCCVLNGKDEAELARLGSLLFDIFLKSYIIILVSFSVFWEGSNLYSFIDPYERADLRADLEHALLRGFNSVGLADSRL